MSYVSDRHPRTHKAMGAFIFLGVLVVATLVAIGGWQLGWWLQTSAEQHRTEIRRAGFERQDTLDKEALRQIGNIRDLERQMADPAFAASAAQIRASRDADVDIVCALIAGLDNPSDPVEVFAESHCD